MSSNGRNVQLFDMNQDFETELRAIRKARASAGPKGLAFFLGACGLALAIMFRIGSAVMSHLEFLFIVLLLLPALIQSIRGRRDVAKIPCPRCHEPYGWSSNYPPNWEVYECQNCELQLQSEKE